MNIDSTPLEIGLVVPSREAHLTGIPARALIDHAVMAEALGFDTVWVGDSLTARPRGEPLTLLSAIAARTERVRIGTAALTAALRPVALAAHSIATLDHLAEGRLTLGIGAGFPLVETRIEFDTAGADYDARLRTLDRNVATWRWLWGPDDVPPPDHLAAEEATALRRLPRPTRPGGPPLWLAGSSPGARRRAACTFDGWLPYPPTPDDYRTQLDDILAARAVAPSPPTTWVPALYVTVVADPDPAQADAVLDEYAQAYYGVDGSTLRAVQAVVTGPSERCAEGLLRYVAAGARHLVLRIGSLDTARHLERMAELAAQVRHSTRAGHAGTDATAAPRPNCDLR